MQRRLRIMAVCALNLSVSRAFSPARALVGHMAARNGIPGSYRSFQQSFQLRRLAAARADGEAFEEYGAKRASFEPNEPAVGPTALQTPGSGGTASTTWPNYYCAPDLERNGRDELLQPGGLDAELGSENARFVLVWQGKNLFRPAGDGAYEAVLLSHVDAAPFVRDRQSIMIFLGKYDGKSVFGLDVSHKESVHVDSHSDVVFEQLRSLGGLLTSDHDAGILASARGMSVWHRTTAFCQRCGSGEMAPAKIGTSRECKSCGARVFPRTDPSVIVAVTCAENQHMLMGRKTSWPAGRYSTLAGFSEMGESLEECVLREVFEESGVRVCKDSLRFSSSQPWPFPRSLMIGFQAAAEPVSDGSLPPITVQVEEMEDVRWFSREQVRAAIAGEDGYSIPGRASLAYSLITSWANSP